MGGLGSLANDRTIEGDYARTHGLLDDAAALAYGGFVISLTEHGHATAFEAFDQGSNTTLTE
jgi:hypothetical protein